MKKTNIWPIPDIRKGLSILMMIEIFLDRLAPFREHGSALKVDDMSEWI